jgi:hypothetical protein
VVILRTFKTLIKIIIPLTGWQKTKAKVNRALGKEYKNTRGVVVPEKVFNDKLCGCKRKCNLKITPTEREGNFAQFYALGNSALQNLYIRGQVHISDVKKRCPKDSSRGPKNCTRKISVL